MCYGKSVFSAGEVVHLGRAFNPKNRGTMDLVGAVPALFNLLRRESVGFALVGGIALLTYVEGRNTEDVDLIMAREDAKQVGWNLQTLEANFGRAEFQGLRIDLLLTDNLLFREVLLNHRSVAQFSDVPDVPSVTRFGLLLLKLYALPSLYRQGNLARAALYETDVRMLLQVAPVSTDDLITALEQHVTPTDLVELRSILDEQRQKPRFK